MREVRGSRSGGIVSDANRSIPVLGERSDMMRGPGPGGRLG